MKQREKKPNTNGFSTAFSMFSDVNRFCVAMVVTTSKQASSLRQFTAVEININSIILTHSLERTMTMMMMIINSIYDFQAAESSRHKKIQTNCNPH